MSTTATLTELAAMLDTLAADLESTRIRVPDAVERSGDAARRSLLADIRRYFAPRLGAPGAPLVIAVIGPSGAGVSSVVNALAGTSVSPAGVLRPTTKVPRMWGPQAARGRWWEDTQLRFGVDADAGVVVGGPETATREYVLVDIPAAIGAADSIDLAARADLCVFVTSPLRYADAEAAALAIGLFERGVPTWFVMNKVPSDPGLRHETLEAYAGLLHSWNLVDTASVDSVDTALMTSDGMIGDDALPSLRGRLASLSDDEARRRILEDAVAARLAAVSVRAEEVAESIEDDRDALIQLVSAAQDAYAEEADRLGADLGAGSFARLAEHSSWSEAAVDLSGIVTRRAGLAAHRATEAWDATDEGRSILAEGGGGLRRHGEQSAFESQGLLEAWLEELGDIATAALASSRTSRRRRTKLGGALWRLVVDPDRTPPRYVRRKLKDRSADVVREARTRLGASMGAALERDAARFDTFLGAPPDVARLGRIITTASLLGVVEPTGFDRPAGPAWGDAERGDRRQDEPEEAGTMQAEPEPEPAPATDDSVDDPDSGGVDAGGPGGILSTELPEVPTGPDVVVSGADRPAAPDDPDGAQAVHPPSDGTEIAAGAGETEPSKDDEGDADADRRGGDVAVDAAEREIDVDRPESGVRDA